MLQTTDWGSVLWLDENKEIVSIEGISVGIVSLLPGCAQARHIHYDEQVIYVIQGQAVSVLDGEESSLKAGDLCHWKPNVMHEVHNIGNVPFQHLLISNPNVEEEQFKFSSEDESGEDRKVPPDMIYIAVEAIRTQFLESLQYGYIIFDAAGNTVLQSRHYPEYCEELCRPDENVGSCPCMRQISGEIRKLENVFECPWGMKVFHYPMFFRGTFLGCIQSGYIRHSKGQRKKETVYDVPDSVIAGIRALLRRIVKAVRNFCEFEQFRRELFEKELRISSYEESQKILMQNLREAKYVMTDLKIKNHFLFNTLNSMASMALEGGMVPLYESIVDLSKMFRYSLKNQNSMVSLEKELGYVEAYLRLQGLRYGDKLKVVYEIQDGVKGALVPFNFLQPIVENAFIHGFQAEDEKKLRIRAERQGNQLRIQVINSGKALTPQACYAINQGILSNTSHGLSMIYQKLVSLYQADFSLRASSQETEGTCFGLEIPWKLEEELTAGETPEAAGRTAV